MNNISIWKYLKNSQEEMPKWLKEYKKGDKINFKDVFSGRFVFSANNGYNKELITQCFTAKYSHVFLCVDYSLTKDKINDLLKDRYIFDNNKLIASQSFTEKDIVPNGWIPKSNLNEKNLELIRGDMSNAKIEPFGVIAIIEKGYYITSNYIGERFAIIYLCAEAVATFDALFLNGYYRAPSILAFNDCKYKDIYKKISKENNLDYEYIMYNERELLCENYKRIKNLSPIKSKNNMNLYLAKKR